MKGHFNLSPSGYATTSSQSVATKIWSLASDWEAVLTKPVSDKQVITGMKINRLTGRKEVSMMLHKMNNTISYNDVRLQNKAWSNMLASIPEISKTMTKGIPIHVTIDNNDGNEETSTGKGTSHDTNFTIFQPLLKDEIPTPREFEVNLCNTEQDFEEYMHIPEYNFGVGKSPQLFEKFDNTEKTDRLEWCLKRDIAWACAESFTEPYSDLNTIGPWTNFN